MTDVQHKNVEIAKMLGWKTNSEKSVWKYGKDDNSYFATMIKSLHDNILTENLKFHSDANWQFEALNWVEKRGWWTDINCSSAMIWNSKFQCFGGERSSKKEAIFAALYEFSQYLKTIV